jgi:hypothetical protein
MAILDRLRRSSFPPKGLFVLVLEDLQPAEVTLDDLDGPYDGRNVVTEQDGSLTFLSEGLPYTIKVASQDGDKLKLESGETVRVMAWPLPQFAP